jgi:hypothetical protein
MTKEKTMETHPNAAVVPPTARIVAVITAMHSLAAGEGKSWTDDEIVEHAYQLALTHSLDELVERGTLFLRLGAAIEQYVHHAAQEDEPDGD